MNFIHVADIHLGVRPDQGKAWSEQREKEIWQCFENVCKITEKEQPDLLLIAGDLFHGQPSVGELKEIDYLLSSFSRTKVVIIAGNHDYIAAKSAYRKFKWSGNIYFLQSESLESIYFPEVNTEVWGFSYYSKEILKNFRELIRPQLKEDGRTNILLFHGGDTKHIYASTEELQRNGFDYIAMGHIHRYGMLGTKRAIYAGSPEPIGYRDTGRHGYVWGSIENGILRTRLIPISCREYITLHIQAENKSSYEICEEVSALIQQQGKEHIYQVLIEGCRDAGTRYAAEDIEKTGNILQIIDYSHPDYDFDRLEEEYKGTLLAQYIRYYRNKTQTPVDQRALYYGVKAMLDTI